MAMTQDGAALQASLRASMVQMADVFTKARIAENAMSFDQMPAGLLSDALRHRYIAAALSGDNVRAEHKDGQWFIVGDAAVIAVISKAVEA